MSLVLAKEIDTTSCSDSSQISLNSGLLSVKGACDCSTSARSLLQVGRFLLRGLVEIVRQVAIFVQVERLRGMTASKAEHGHEQPSPVAKSLLRVRGIPSLNAAGHRVPIPQVFAGRCRQVDRLGQERPSASDCTHVLAS